MSIEIFKRDYRDDFKWKPDTEHELFRMPGGEYHVKGAEFDGEYAAVVRGSSADDIMGLAILSDAVHRSMGGGYIHLVMPYFPGARQDRWREGEALSVKVYADIINAMGFVSVTILDPHSIVTPALVNNCIVNDGAKIAADTVAPIAPFIKGVIVPDAGAVKRSTAVADLLGVPTFQATKKRDPQTGQLSGFEIHVEPLTHDDVYLVVDDICDAGGTFKGLARAIGLGSDHLALFATHGVFSGEAHTLDVYYGDIFTTDSIHPGLPSNFFSPFTFTINPVVESLLPS